MTLLLRLVVEFLAEAAVWLTLQAVIAGAVAAAAKALPIANGALRRRTVALGAFIAGSLVAESGEEHQIVRLVEPVRDVFAAVFFVSVGMLIDPALVLKYWPAVAALTATVLFGKVFGVSLGAFVSGAGMRTSVQAGMSLAQIGEFSFIIAALGLSLRATGEFLYPVAVAVSAVTTLSTPWLIRGSGPVAAWVDRRLPRPLQTFATLYGCWLEELRGAPRANTALADVRRLVRLLALDGIALAVIILGTSAMMASVLAFAKDHTNVPQAVARAALVLGAVGVAAPFGVGVIRVGRRLGVTVARQALPARAGRGVDLAAAPRRALVVTLQVASVMLVGAPLLALTQPFLPGVWGAALLAAVLVALGLTFWRSATNLQGHVRAGAQVIVAALAAQGRSRALAAVGDALEGVHNVLPGLGSLFAVQLDGTSPANNKTLAQLNLRGLTGATVLAITRGDGGVIVPSANEELRPGDVLALAGTHEAIEAARAVLRG